MGTVALHMPSGLFRRIHGHLLPPEGVCEEAAFLFASRRSTTDCALDVFDAETIGPNGFTRRSPYYLELTDATRATVIKRAHDLDAVLVECHSHPNQNGACFSWSDLHGFDEFVPHVMWRLKGRPYAAIVMARDSFDGLMWPARDASHTPLHEIVTEEGALCATGLTHQNWSEIYERQSI